MSIEDPNENVESPCRSTGEWAFVGYLQVAKDQESAVPIGVYSDYALGKAAANAWMTNTGRAIRWEAQKLYESLETGEAGTEAVEETTFFTDDEDGE